MAEYIIGTVVILADLAILVVARYCPNFRNWIKNLATDEDED